MYVRPFFFLVFIISSAICFLSSYYPSLTLHLCASIYKEGLTINFIQLTSMLTAAFSILIFAVGNHYLEKKILAEKERIAAERLNIEAIHSEIKALRER